ncbi:hypothetical protein IGJ83_000370 [Enterococcus pernyi]
MSARLRRTMLLLGTIILVIQTAFMPIGILSAETTMDTDEHEQQAEIPPEKNSLEKDLAEDPRFFFTKSQWQGMAGDPINVTLSSDQEVSEVQVILPEEATIIKEQLSEGTSLVQGEQPQEWLIQSEHAQTTFILPLVFKTVGNYELSMGEVKATVKIQEQASIENPADEMKESSELIENDYSQYDESLDSYQTNPSFDRKVIEFRNPLFSYGPSEQFIDGWSLFIGPGILGPLTELSISNTLDSNSEFRYAFDGTETTDRVLFRNKSDNEGLRVRLKENTTLIAGQSFNTVPGKEYLVRGGFTGNARKALIVYEGEEVFSGSGGLGSTEEDPNGFREVSFIAQSSIYSISSRIFAFTGEEFGESAINLVAVGEKINMEIKYLDENGNELHESNQFYGIKGEDYEVKPIDIPGYILKSSTSNYKGVLSENGTIIFQYVTEKVDPVDPLNPEIEVDPENSPELPEKQGLLSIDFVSSFNFGTQAISIHDKTYYAQAQRLLDEDGVVNENEERSNYVQVSDRRPESERNGWELAVTQKEQFKGEENQVLNGASISLSNQQVVSAQGGTAPGLQSVPCELIPGNRRTLLKAQGNEGVGTWIYRFGDAETAKESVALNVPKGANPEAISYSTTLTWELSAVPDN